QKKCWKKGGRKKCMKNRNYQNFEFDLHNLQPSIGEINGDRSNFMYSELNSNVKQYGKCSMKIDFKKKLVEPPKIARGAIARTYFYMNTIYNLKLSIREKKLFNKWNLSFPVTKWECIREHLIFKIQEQEKKNIESPLLIHLGLVISKNKKMNFAIQKSIELGVHTITPIFSQYFGCEGGFSLSEVQKAIKHEFIPVKLGPRILRTETAAIAAVTALQIRFGDL
ncbi:Endonuclease-1, partial [Aphis craccivora]